MLIGFTLLFKGGDFLIVGAAGIAKKKNIPPFIIGITLVAFGTSAPELFFNIIASVRGHAEFALSNVAGSNLVNICIGIGISSLIYELKVYRHKFLTDLIFLIFCPALILLFVLISHSSSLNIFHGILLLFVFFFYIYLTRKKFNNHNISKNDPEDSSHEVSSCSKEWLLFVAGCIMLYIGGELVFRNALSIVSKFNVTESLVGLTVIALGTSIPDCAASIIATIKKHHDIAVGNILGSNNFNLLLVLGSTILTYQKPIDFSQNHLFDFFSVLILSILFFLFAYICQRISKFSGFIILAYYPIYLLIRLTVIY